MQPLRVCDRERRCTQVLAEEAPQVPARDAEALGELFDRPVIECTRGDQPQAAPDGGRRTAPGGRARCALGPTAQTRPVAGLARCRGTGIKRDVFFLRCHRRTDRPAVNARRFDADKKLAVKARVA